MISRVKEKMKITRRQAVGCVIKPVEIDTDLATFLTTFSETDRRPSLKRDEIFNLSIRFTTKVSKRFHSIFRQVDETIANNRKYDNGDKNRKRNLLSGRTFLNFVPVHFFH